MHSSNGSRSLLPMSNTSKSVPPLPSPTSSVPDRSGLHHRKSSSGHVRNPSISLSSPSSQNSPSLLPSHAQHPDSRKILPLQPAATGTASRTRAPLDTFASVEMLQGQREALEKTRGTEVWGPGGYEGRASSVSENSGLPVRRVLSCVDAILLTRQCLVGLLSSSRSIVEPSRSEEPCFGSTTPFDSSRRRNRSCYSSDGT